MSFLENLIGEGLQSSTVKPLGSTPTIITPFRMIGEGDIYFGRRVRLGTIKGAGAYTMSQLIVSNGGEIYIEDDVVINNNFHILAYGSRVTIGKETVIGSNLQIMTFNGHQVSPGNRKLYDSPRSIYIGSNCWLGNDVKLLKGASIGSNSVIGIGCIIDSSLSIPESSLVKFGKKSLSISIIK